MPASGWPYGTIKELSEALSARRISASELLQLTIERIEALDSRINSVVVRDFERARQAARAADLALARGERRALLGIPFTVKEAINVAGLPTTWGFPEYKDFVPKEDAVVVTRAKNAGAILLGKTNVPLGLGDFQSYNDIYGTTNNPWNVSRSPGGSSGGSAAALAAGFGPVSFGSDIGGSLRVPAHFCGVCAHKPSFGLFPFRGYNRPPNPPLPVSGDLAVIGPLGRSAADLATALDAVAGPDEESEGIGYRLTLPPARHRDLREFRVLVIDRHPVMPIGSAVSGAINHRAEQLAKAGAKIARSSDSLPDLADSARIFMRLLGAARSAGATPEIYEKAKIAVAALQPGDTSLAAERSRGLVMNHRDWLATDQARQRLKEQWRRLFREWDIVLYPPAPFPAFPHDHSLPIEARHIEIDGEAHSYNDAFYVWADPATTCGLPATVAPIGHSPTGLPIGVQIIGPYLEDRTTIAFAELIETEFGGFVPPPGYAG
jgi:amidase